MIFCLALSDATLALVHLTSSIINSHSPWLCQGFGIIRSWASLSSILWPVAIGVFLWISIHDLSSENLFSKQNHPTNAELMSYQCVCWGLPCVLAFLPLLTHTYGYQEETCWLNQGSWVLTWRILIFYGWTLLAYLICFGVYLDLYLFLKTQNTTKAESVARKIKYYPAVLILATLPGLINEIREWILGERSYGLMIASQICFGLIGFLNSMVYGFSLPVRRELMMDCGCLERTVTPSSETDPLIPSPS